MAVGSPRPRCPSCPVCVISIPRTCCCSCDLGWPGWAGRPSTAHSPHLLHGMPSTEGVQQVSSGSSVCGCVASRTVCTSASCFLSDFPLEPMEPKRVRAGGRLCFLPGATAGSPASGGLGGGEEEPGPALRGLGASQATASWPRGPRKTAASPHQLLRP